MTAEIHTVFRDRIKALQALARANADAYLGKTSGEWAVPTDLEGDLTDPTSLTPVFDREEINANYSESLQGAGTGRIGDVVALQRQIGFVAAEERAMRMRYMRPPRAVAHANGRLDGHANDNGIFGKVRIAAENLVKAGSAAIAETGATS